MFWIYSQYIKWAKLIPLTRHLNTDCHQSLPNVSENGLQDLEWIWTQTLENESDDEDCGPTDLDTSIKLYYSVQCVENLGTDIINFGCLVP